MAKPKILIFSTAYWPFIGGAELAVKEITDRLGQDYDLDLLTVNFDGQQKAEEVVGSIRIFRLGSGLWSKYFFPLQAVRKAIQLHKKNSYQATWAIMANQAGMAAARFKRLTGLPLLLTIQEGDEVGSFSYQLRLFGPRLYQVFAAADRIQVISNYLATWTKSMGAQSPVTVIPNGVDLAKFKFQPKTIPGSGLVTITSASRLVEKNGLDILIRALTFLPNQVRLVIYGGGPEQTNLQNLVKNLNLTNRVDLAGEVKAEDLPSKLAKADIFCRPSRSEGLGNAFLEAMAIGLPTIGPAVGGIPDFLHDRETGFVCAGGDPKSVADQINFISDPANQEIVGAVVKRARKVVEDKYDWAKISLQFKAIFDLMLK